MQKFLLLISLLISIHFVGFSQTRYIDSLEVELKSAKKIEKINLFYRLGRLHLYRDSLKSRQYIDKGLELSIENNKKDLELRGLFHHSFIDDHFDMAQSVMDRSLHILSSEFDLTVNDSAEVIGLMGSALSKLGAYEFAIIYRKKLIDFNKRHQLTNPYYPVENIAYLFAEINQFDSANYYYEKAFRIAKEIPEQHYIMHCLNNMGFNYYVQNKYDKASFYYQKAIDHFIGIKHTQGDSIMYAAVLGNIANIASKKSEFQKAYDYRIKAITILKKLDFKLWALHSLRLVNDELELGMYDEAISGLDSCYQYLDLGIDHPIHYYKLLSKYYNKTGQKQLEIDAQKLQIDAINKKMELRKMDYKVNDFVNYQTDRIQSELNLQRILRSKNERINFLWILSISGATTLLLIIFFILFKFSKIKLENQKIKSQKLKEELTYKKKDLTDFAIDITRKHEFIKELLGKLERIDKTASKEGDSIKEIISYIKSQLIIDKNMKLFQENIDKVNYEFLSFLSEKFPDLTPNEKQLCSLLKLQLSTKEIATIKNISPNSTKVLRSRLRKKLNLSPEESLQEFIINLK